MRDKADLRRTVGIGKLAAEFVLVLIGLLAFVLLIAASIAVFKLWHDTFSYGDVSWWRLAFHNVAWVFLLSLLTALLTFRFRLELDFRETAFRLAAIASPVSLLLILVLVNLPQPAVTPVDTVGQARPRLEAMVKRRADSFPQAIRIQNLRNQIRHIEISGPQMTFDPATARYITFDFDTGCGEVVEAQATFDHGGPDNLHIPHTSACR